MFVLILVALGTAVGQGGSLNQTGFPIIVGTFSTMTACQTAASEAKIVKAGTLPQSLYTGAVFLCAEKE
jgi:hypothetical protein